MFLLIKLTNAYLMHSNRAAPMSFDGNDEPNMFKDGVFTAANANVMNAAISAGITGHTSTPANSTNSESPTVVENQPAASNAGPTPAQACDLTTTGSINNSQEVVPAAGPLPLMLLTVAGGVSLGPISKHSSARSVARSKPRGKTAWMTTAQSAKKKKSEKVVKPNASVSPRYVHSFGSYMLLISVFNSNLCLLDWLETHPNGTEGAFEEYLETLDVDSQEVRLVSLMCICLDF